MKKVLIIDNYDSFTYILKQYFGELKASPEVFFHDELTVSQIKKLKPTHIVLSPGPGTAEEQKDVGIMFEVIEEFYQKIPILGVCLGHQAIGKFFAQRIVHTPRIMHGKRSLIHHDRQGIFQGLKNPFEAMRYHSLTLDFSDSKLQDQVGLTAQSDDGVVMAIQHKKYPVFGVQFHPESLGTKEGKKIIRNFLKY